MRLAGIVSRPPLRPSADGEKLPWDEPAFSVRMLAEHLSQAHDRASRRIEVIDRQVEWLQRVVMQGRASRVLDLCCGPGFYCSRLARFGHTCAGIDFAPAAIEHARTEAERGGLECEYRLQDVRAGGYGDGFGLVTLLSGELNVFTPAAARGIVLAAREALLPEGALVLEVHTEDYVRKVGEGAPRWSAQKRGLFSDSPHLLLRERAWIPESRTSVERFLVIDAATAAVECHSITTQAYSESEYDSILREAGYSKIQMVASLQGDDGHAEDGLFVLVARP